MKRGKIFLLASLVLVVGLSSCASIGSKTDTKVESTVVEDERPKGEEIDEALTSIVEVDTTNVVTEEKNLKEEEKENEESKEIKNDDDSSNWHDAKWF